MPAENGSRDLVVGVGRLGEYIKKRLDRDPQLRVVNVRGELAEFNPQPGATVRFKLKDQDGRLECIAWGRTVAGFPKVANGQCVVATGSVTAWPKDSVYQLLVSAIRYDGIGELAALFEELKSKLGAEGLFDPQRKRKLPAYPFRVALVTSNAGKAKHDFVQTLAARAPHVTVIMFDTLVQGANAARDIARAIDLAGRSNAEVIAVVRGGGSYEDLFAFNAEEVIRAIARTPVPVVSGVGHQTDTTLCDFAADATAATPTAAAERIAPKRADLSARIVRLRRACERDMAASLARRANDLGLRAGAVMRSMRAGLSARRELLLRVERRLDRAGPQARLAAAQRRFAELPGRLDRAAAAANGRAALRVRASILRLDGARLRMIDQRRRRLDRVQAGLHACDPEAILAKGYAIVRVDGYALRDAASVSPGTVVNAKLARGTLWARVERSVGDDS